MTSRRTLSSGLGLVLVLAALQATIGCQVVFPLRDPERHNRLRCNCVCDGAGSRQAPILASSDDAEQTGVTVNLTDGDLDLGEAIVGLRFDGVKLARGAIIESAYVQFTAGGGQSIATNLTISAEASAVAATFTNTDDDLGARVVTGSVAWSPSTWAASDGAGPEQRTPELKTLLQALVDQPDWSDASAVVLRFAGTGHRTAEAIDGGPAAVLVVTFDATVAATLPVCASADVVRDSAGRITEGSLAAECSRVEETLEGLAEQCQYPTPCECEVFDVPDQSDSGQSDVCNAPCTETAVDATCTNFDPNGFAACLATTASVEDCKHLVAATNATGDSPVCVDSGSPFAFHLFGRRSQCELAGTAEIHVGDREPKQDPVTEGIAEILGGPCPGGGCPVHPYFDLRMAPITFAVKFHSDPTFSDLKASGRAVEAAVTDAGGMTLPAHAVTGTGSGRRGSTPGLAITATNESPLDVGIDFAARTCAMHGNVATAVDGEVPDGVCDGDGATACTADSPDCDDVGGPCVFEATDTEAMSIDVALDGTLVNQPPAAAAGADQTVECTSPAGASFLLDGRASTDPDHDLTLVSWRQGSRLGAEVGNDLVVSQALGVGASQDYALLVLDSHAQSDLDQTTVAVVDTTPPVIACNAPATLRPNQAPITFAATATDVCDASVVPQVVAYDCFAFTNKGKRIDKRRSCVVSFQGSSVRIHDSGGYGDHIQWTVRASDDTGNLAEVVCEVVIAK